MTVILDTVNEDGLSENSLESKSDDSDECPLAD